jgi:hypothetical protein
MTNLLLLAGIACSLAMIGWLRHGDPKRRRVAQMAVEGPGGRARPLIVSAAVLPGAMLAMSGNSAAFLIWLGVCAIGGWLIAQLR